MRTCEFLTVTELRLFFYYLRDEYMGYLMTVPEAGFIDEIDRRDLFDGKNCGI